MTGSPVGVTVRTEGQAGGALEDRLAFSHQGKFA